MEGAARIFAGEYCHSTLSRGTPGQDTPLYVVTPTGSWCNLVLLSGVITELSGHGARLRCRIADPTGAFDCTIAADSRPDLAEAVRKIPVPSFLTVSGSARLEGGTAAPSPVIRPDSIRIVDRAVRDAWIARTAACSIRRIAVLTEALRDGPADDRIRIVLDHYQTTPAGLLEYLAMVESAVAGLSMERPAPIGQQDIRDSVISIIRDLQGSRGISIEDVIARAGILGISHEGAKAVIDDLIREDECYQPQKGTVRLL